MNSTTNPQTLLICVGFNSWAKSVSAAAMLALSPYIYAQEAAPTTASQQSSVQDVQPAMAEKTEKPRVIGQATRQLLHMQAQGTLASERRYLTPVAVGEKIYQRYLDSFAHPIPERMGSTLSELE